MQRPDVTELFKYMPKIDRAFEMLKSKQVWCSKPEHFNDPFDGSIPFEVDYPLGAFVSAAVTLYAKDGHKWDDIKNLLDSHISQDCKLNAQKRADIERTAKEYLDSNQNAGVLSLSEQPLSILMWAHYGANHKGVCVGFERNSTNDLGDDDACSPVFYSDFYPKPRFSQLLAADGTLTRDLLFTKARDWAYEKEWRLITEKGNATVKCPGAITKVIIGCRAEPKTEADFLTECQRQKIPFYRARQVPDAFMLELTPLFTP